MRGGQFFFHSLMLPYVEPYELAEWMDKDPNSVIVVDVRDTDYSQYKIPGARHIPYPEVFRTTPKLVEQIQALPKQPESIVFHCMFWFAYSHFFLF